MKEKVRQEIDPQSSIKKRNFAKDKFVPENSFMLVLVLIFPLIFALFSCDAASGFLLDVDEELTIETIVPGSILQKGDEIPIALKFNESTLSPDYLEVLFLTKKGENVGKFELEYKFRSNGSFPTPVVADNLDPGQYTLKLLIKDGTSVLTEKSIDFFLVDRDIRILSVNTTPSRVKPGSDVLLSVNLSEEATGYFIRWKFKERILKEDFLENGGDRVTFKAPDLEGIYVVQVEIFPGKVESSVNSSLYSLGELLVTEDSSDTAYELTGEENFTLLYRFSGDLKDSGKGKNKETDAGSVTKGRFVPMQKEGSFGYFFNGESSIYSPFSAFPTDEEGRLKSFAVSGQIAPYRANKAGRLFYTEDGKGDLSLQIDYNGKGRLTAVLSDKGEKRALSLPLRADEKLSWLILTVVFDGSHVTLSWYVDGKPAASSVFSSQTPVASEGGNSVLGGNGDGFYGFIGDWGVVKAAQSEEGSGQDFSDLFNQVTRIIYGDRLIYFNQFNRASDVKQIRFFRKNGSGNPEPDRVSAQEKKLIISSGSSAVFPRFTPEKGKVKIRIDSSSPSGDLEGVSLVLNTGVLNSGLNSSNPQNSNGSISYSFPLNFTTQTTEIELVVDPDQKTIIFQSEGTEKKIEGWESVPIICSIENTNPSGNSVKIDSILIVSQP